MERNGSYYQFDREAEALLTGTEPTVSVDEARWTVRLQEAIRASVTDDSTSADEGTAESGVASDD